MAETIPPEAGGSDDLTASMAEGSISAEVSKDGKSWKLTGARLFSLALIVLIPYTVAAAVLAFRTGDINSLEKLALVVVAFFFGRKT